ncbi:MAG: PRC-barrel domain-containing protein [Thermoplasmata archaeon]
MLREVSEFIGLKVYTQNGVLLGAVSNLIVDIDRGRVDGLFLGETNPVLVEGGKAVSVPYRWTQTVGDIVVLRYFPKKVQLHKVSGRTAPVVPQ